MLSDRFGEHDEFKEWTDSNQSGVCGLDKHVLSIEASAQFKGLKGSAANVSVSHTAANLQENPEEPRAAEVDQ